MRVNGIELNVQVRGSGKPLVLLHGMGGNVNEWRYEVDHFGESYQTIAMDLRGHGRSDRPASYTLEDHVEDVLGVMDAMGLPTAYLMGISMGSTVAQGVATRAPQRISKLVLLVPRPAANSSGITRFLDTHVEERRGMTMEETQQYVWSSIFAPTTPPEVREAQSAFIQSQAEAGLTLTPPQSLAASRAMAGRAGKGYDFRPLLPKVTARTLVISGRYDPFHLPEEGREIAELIPGAQFVLMERSGHLPMREEPERFLSLVDAFLRE